MKLEQLSISRNTYNFAFDGVAPSAIGGKVKFSDPNSHEVTLILTPAHIDRILAIVAETMVETTRALAEDLTANIIQHAAQLLPVLELEQAA